ncbi:hypothetical protein A8806_110142 [Faecalicatena orotica]|uniref:Uncharacterized protein n=1 Tax=Faecalicatena orotica TaxID=1544 RepID=A0A2Y9C5V2_9FIRM|nr:MULTISPECIES: hypothetical protein [Faecalicatena]MCI6468146.1 hypothetical protein [Faecalicatena sp.]PWJ27967.1 hypothetical protein A8806_110142 [Faecalicatena orotica]SSA56990.1 hypothetical protein SAMN05216536_110142 [Faecalicatena orotica]
MKDSIKNVLINLIQEAKRDQERANKSAELVFNTINDIFNNPDLQKIPTGAENAENLEEAIACYIQYGEYDIQGIIKELETIRI